jgi:hypothetical protein
MKDSGNGEEKLQLHFFAGANLMLPVRGVFETGKTKTSLPTGQDYGGLLLG